MSVAGDRVLLGRWCMKRRYTRERLEAAVRQSVSMSELLRCLGLSDGGTAQRHVRRLIENFGIDTSHFVGRHRYTREVLERAVRDSVSVAGVLRALGLRQAGGT